MRSRGVRRGLALLALGSFVLAYVFGPAAVSSATSTTSTTTTSTTTKSTATTSTTSATSKTPTSGNWIGVAQTVVVSTTADGKVSGTPQVFTQWSANGSTPATLKVPMSSSGFRNLSSLGTPPVKDGYAVWNLHLTGPTHQRAVAHFPSSKLPVQVSAAYELNGKKMSAKDIVGKTGELKVTYVISNVTTKPTKVTFKNVFGSKETTTVKAPVPVAAVVDVTVPAKFTNLKAPGASASGNGNGNSSASWTLFLFNPLGGVKQSVTYQAHVTDAIVPSATVEAAVLPPTNVKPLPQITEPGAPAVPAVSLGGNLAAIQVKVQAARAKLATKASAVLDAFKQIAVPAVRGVSTKAATVAGNLPTASTAAQTASLNASNTATSLGQLSTGASDASTRAADVSAGLKQDSVDASDASTRAADLHAGLVQDAANAGDHAAEMADIRTGLEALPDSIKVTKAYRDLHRRVDDLEARLTLHAARLRTDAAAAELIRLHLIDHAVRLRDRAAKANLLALRLTAVSDLVARTSSAETNVVVPAAQTASTDLIGLVPKANVLSTNAAKTATSLNNATIAPGKKKKPKQIHTREIGGGAKLDSAVGQLDGAITEAGDKVDNAYAYLTALNQRAAANKLPGGDAVGATAQAGAFVYSVSGANRTAHQTHLAIFIGGFALVIGLTLGISLYRIRRGMPSSMAPPKSSAAAA
jgi:hypothetical protein